MPRHILTVKRDAVTGELGLVIEGVHIPEDTLSVAYEGLLIAHDLTEHVNGLGEVGSIDDELEAMGGIWFVRGQHNDFRRGRYVSEVSPVDNMASDITRMFVDHIQGGQYVNLRHKVTRAHPDHDDTFREIVNEAARAVGPEIDPGDRPDDYEERLGAYSARALAGLRTGYRKAAKRWRALGTHGVNSLFWAIADAVEPYCKNFDYEGQQYELTYDAATRRAWCSEYYPTDEDY